jgi:hypothetical protein
MALSSEELIHLLRNYAAGKYPTDPVVLERAADKIEELERRVREGDEAPPQSEEVSPLKGGFQVQVTNQPRPARRARQG